MARPPLRQPSPTVARPLLTARFDLVRLRPVRHDIETASRGLGLHDEQVDDWITAVNELLINAIRHGGGDGTVRLWQEDRLICEVTDEGPGFDAAAHLSRSQRPAFSGTGGMGLWVVGELADYVSVDSGPSGTTIRIAAR